MIHRLDPHGFVSPADAAAILAAAGHFTQEDELWMSRYPWRPFWSAQG
jgi:hypothetical protein